MANEYVSWATLEATLGLSGETTWDTDGAVAVEAASRAIDEACGRRFYADADANQVRYYSPSLRTHLPIDDLVTLTSVLVDTNGDGTFEETWTQNTDFVLEPLNPELIDASNRKPWTRIRLHPASSVYLPHYPRSVKVTGKFGWAATPPPIVQATTVIATRLLKRAREAPFGALAFGEQAIRIARTDPDMALLLAPFVREPA